MARVLINALGVTMGGSLRHITAFLPALSDAANGRTFDVLVRRSMQPALEPLANLQGIELHFIGDRWVRSPWARLVFDNRPGSYARFDADAIVSLTNFGPVFARVPHVLFQRNALYFSEPALRRTHGAAKAKLQLQGSLALGQMLAADVVVTPSTAMRDLIVARHPRLRSKRFVTLHHAVDVATFAPSRAERDAPTPERPFVWLYPSHLGNHKGLDILLPAMKLLAKESTNFVVRIPASYDQVALTLRTQRRQDLLGCVDAQLELIGEQPQSAMPALYRDADAMVYPSLCESFGFSMVEAMAARLPTLAADTPVNRELCAGAAAYYDAENARACAEGMRRIMHDATLRAGLCCAAGERMHEYDWSWRRYAREFLALCDDILQRQAPIGAASSLEEPPRTRYQTSL